MIKVYTSRELASYLKVHIATVQNWDRKGILKSCRTATNRRYYTEDQINEFLKLKNKENHNEFSLQSSL